MKLLLINIVIFNLFFAGLLQGQVLKTVKIDVDSDELSIIPNVTEHSGHLLVTWTSMGANQGFVFFDTTLAIKEQFAYGRFLGPNKPPDFHFKAFKGGDIYGRGPTKRILKYDVQKPIFQTRDTLSHYYLSNLTPGSFYSITTVGASLDSQNLAAQIYRIGDSTISTVKTPIPYKDRNKIGFLGGSVNFNLNRDTLIYTIRRDRGRKYTAVLMDTTFALLDSFKINNWPPPPIKKFNYTEITSVSYLGNNEYVINGAYSKVNTHINCRRCYAYFTYIYNDITNKIRSFQNFTASSYKKLRKFQGSTEYWRNGFNVYYGSRVYDTINFPEWADLKVKDTSGQIIIDTVFQFEKGMDSKIFDVVRLSKYRYIFIGAVFDTDTPGIEEFDLILQKVDLRNWNSIGLIEENSGMKFIRLFPNPAQNFVNIETSLVLKDFRLFTVSGEKVRTGMIQRNRIPLKNLESGMYLLEITSNKGNSWIKRLELE